MSTSTANPVFCLANQSFSRRQYDECALLLVVMIESAVKSNNWSEAVRCLIMFGRCRQATGQYDKASVALGQAQSLIPLLGKDEGTALQCELDSRIEQAEMDKASYASWEQLRERCTALCNSGDFEQAETLCFQELARVRSTLSAHNWYVAAITKLRLGCCMSQISGMVNSDEIAREQVESRLEACRSMLASVRSIANDQVNEHRAHWLVQTCENVDELFDQVEQQVQEILTRQSEESASTLLATINGDDSDDESVGNVRAWQQPFAQDLVLTFTGQRVERILQDMHDLFIRAEWDACLERAQDLLEEADERGHLPMALVAWVMMTRGMAHKGDYGTASACLRWAAAAAASIPAPAGPPMIRSVHRLSESLVRDCARAQRAEALAYDCSLYADSDQFAQVRGILEEAAESNDEGWMAAVVNCLRSRYVLLEASWQQGNDTTVDAQAEAESAREFLEIADRQLSDCKDVPHWVFRAFRLPAREALYAFCDAEGI